MDTKVGADLITAGYRLGLAATGSLAFVWSGTPAAAQPMPVARTLPFDSFSFGGGIGLDQFHAPMSITSSDIYASEFSGIAAGSGHFATAEIGKDFRSGNTVFGIYADYTHGEKAGGIHQQSCIEIEFCITTTGTVTLGDSRSLIGRVGTMYSPTTLLYGLAGLTWQDYAARVATNFELTTAASRQGTLSGWVVGFGAEAMIYPTWSLKGEYRFAQFESIGAFSASGCCGSVNGNFGEVTDHIFRVVLSFKSP